MSAELLHLAIDTSTSRPVVALLRGRESISSWIGPAGTQHNETLLAGIDECLRTAQVTLNKLQWLDLGVGPGMFTGLRVGVATAKFLAESQGIPIAPVSSLLALNLGANGTQDSRIFSLSDARSGRIYVLCLSATERSVLFTANEDQEIALQPQEVAGQMKPGDYLVGEAALLYRDFWPEGVILAKKEEDHILSATQVGRIGLSLFERGLCIDPLIVEPRYLKTGQKHL